MKRNTTGWWDLFLGVALGAVLTAAGIASVNFVKGWQHVGLWKRAITNRSVTDLESLMKTHIQDARGTIEDHDPYPLNHILASSTMPSLYDHYLRYSRHLLESKQVPRFNELRLNTRFVGLDLSDSNLGGLDLTGVNFNGATLNRTVFIGSNLTDATFFNASLGGADLSNAQVERASFVQADLSNATLNGIRGHDANFTQAVLVNASLTGIRELSGAVFHSAILAQANLMGSSFPGSSFDRADLTLASAVGSDFSQAETMDNVVFTAANLGEATINPEVTWNAWLENADGLDQTTIGALRVNDGVFDPETLLTRVDSRIVAGLRAQVEADTTVPPDQRQAVLLDLLQQYWMQ